MITLILEEVGIENKSRDKKKKPLTKFVHKSSQQANVHPCVMVPVCGKRWIKCIRYKA